MSTKTKFEDVAPSSDPLDLDIDEDGTIYGDKAIFKTPEEVAATPPVKDGWRDPFKERVSTPEGRRLRERRRQENETT